MSVTDGRRGIFWMDDAVLDEHAKVLGVYGFAVYAILCRRANKNGDSYPTIRRIAEDLDISTRQAKRELKKLRDKKYIGIKTRAKDGGQISSVYTVFPLPRGGASRDRGGDSQSPGVGPHSHPEKEDTVVRNTLTNVSEPDGSLEHISQAAKNWFTVFCDRVEEEGLLATPEDRKRVPGHLKKVAEEASPKEMARVVSAMVEARHRNYPMSPQEALNKVRGVPTGRRLQVVEPPRPQKRVIS